MARHIRPSDLNLDKKACQEATTTDSEERSQNRRPFASCVVQSGRLYTTRPCASGHKPKPARLRKFQPPYSPNLNLIERLYKFMRNKFCKDKYRGTFDEFREKLDAFFANLDQYRTELASLLAENFELVPAVWKAPASA